MKKEFWVVRSTKDGLCTTHDSGAVVKPWEYCSGPYGTEKEATDWIAQHCDDAMQCKKEECDCRRGK